MSDMNAENEIVGEALVALQHDDLKQMGIASVGHRLTILKSVYDVKRAQDVPIESDHYVPLCKRHTSESLFVWVEALIADWMQRPMPKLNTRLRL